MLYSSITEVLKSAGCPLRRDFAGRVCVVGVGGRGWVGVGVGVGPSVLVSFIVWYHTFLSAEGTARTHVNMRTRAEHGMRSERFLRPNQA